MTEKLAKSAFPEVDLLKGIKEKILANKDLRTAMFAGCEIETFVEDHEDGSKTLTVKTKNPISILKASDGRVINVYERKPDGSTNSKITGKTFPKI